MTLTRTIAAALIALAAVSASPASAGSTYELTARKNGRDYYIVVSAWSGNIIRRQSI